MLNSLPNRTLADIRSVRSPQPIRLRRRLATLGGLGLAGLVAGLLSGCSLPSTIAAATTSTTPSSSSAPTTPSSSSTTTTSTSSSTGTASTSTSTTSTATSTDPSSTSSSSTPASTGNSTVSWASLAGNWGFTAAQGTPVSASTLTSLGGSIAVADSSVSAVLHPLVAGQCIATSEALSLAGSITPAGVLTLSGQSSQGAVVNITGTVASDAHSLTGLAVTAGGGACIAAATPHFAGLAHRRDGSGGFTAQQYQPVTGTYAGTLTDDEGDAFSLTTTVTQLDQPGPDGSYHIQGTASAPDNPCVPNAVTATASALAGGTLSVTFDDGMGTTISATGSASADGSTITLTGWQINSACGGASGNGLLTRQ